MENNDHTKMGNDFCPFCDYMSDSASALGEEHVTPMPGDISICLNCGEWLQFANDMALIKIKKETLNELEPQQIIELRLATKFIRERGQIK